MMQYERINNPMMSGVIVCEKQLSHKYICGFVFALKCATVKRSSVWCDWM